MEVVLFLSYRTPRSAGPAPLAEFTQRLADVPGATRAVVHVPADASDPYLKDEGPPSAVVQITFGDLGALEAASAADGALQAITDRRSFAWIGDAEITQQAMVVRAHRVPDPTPAAAPACTYLVAYEGTPQDYDAWLGHYHAHHVPLMLRLPGLRALEIYTRLDWISALPARRENAVQRNQVVFDSPAALTDALNSPIRHEMRRDFEASPPFDGHNTHFPMTSHPIALASLAPTLKENA